MFFDDLTEIPKIARRTSCAIFVLPSSSLSALEVNDLFSHAIQVRPEDDKSTDVISVEKIRNLIALTNSVSTTERFFIISPAETMNEAAQNAFLKTFEEPGYNYHFVLLTTEPLKLLPTIRSRAQVFYQKVKHATNSAPQATPDVIAQAKRLITADSYDLTTLAGQLATAKPKPREQTLEVISTAIDLLYKSYFKTQNEKFLTKLPNLLNLYDNLQANGHIKLHAVADLL